MRTLYQFHDCPFCFKVRLALREKGLPFDPVEVDPAYKPEEMLAVAPLGQVPVLVEDAPRPDEPGFAIFESSAIVEYLDTLAGPPLYPPGPKSRAKARMLEAIVSNGLLPAVRALQIELAKPDPDSWDLPLVRKQRTQLSKFLGFLDRTLGEREFFFGQFSIVECALAKPLCELEAVGVDLAAHPGLQALAARLDGRLSVLEARKKPRPPGELPDTAPAP
jgi:glutathione S-transferase